MNSTPAAAIGQGFFAFFVIEIELRNYVILTGTRYEWNGEI
jgi:hypothetical protein